MQLVSIPIEATKEILIDGVRPRDLCARALQRGWLTAPRLPGQRTPDEQRSYNANVRERQKLCMRRLREKRRAKHQVAHEQTLAECSQNATQQPSELR
jgi:hypothetical protein